MRRSRVLMLLALLAFLTYLPALLQPFIEDDYPNILLARAYGPLSGWKMMFGDPTFRLRATTWLWFYWMNRLFHLHAAGYYACMIVIHILDTWLIYALGMWRAIGYKVAAFAAAFFAVYEGHQEAIMWLSGSTEPLLALFGLTALLCWLKFLETPGPGWYVASMAAFCCGLFSKESGVILIALLALPLIFEREVVDQACMKRWLSLSPFALLAMTAAASIFIARSSSFRFQDGSFSLRAPFWIVLPLNFWRLLWIWGLVALVALGFWKLLRERSVLIGLAWMALSLIPYSFLTYSRNIPSRQLYLASVGLSIVVGAAAVAFAARWPANRSRILAAVCAIVIAHNVGYVWTRKRIQFERRAEPTEKLLALARSTSGAIFMQCFPRGRLVADSALELMLTPDHRPHLIWTDGERSLFPRAQTFCYRER